MNSFTIKDLENLTGIKAHTIRIWEQRYNFLKPQRTDTNIRYYSNDELKKILNVSLLNKNGFKISYIDVMSNEEMADKILQLENPEGYNERVVNMLIEAMIDVDNESFEHKIQTEIEHSGIDVIIRKIIFPFLEKIGILWMTGNINPAQEHLVTNIIRQKIIVGIDSLRPSVSLNAKALLFLPEDEHHELGLLYVYYLLKSKGFSIQYLGASVPLPDLMYITKYKRPDFIYTHITSTKNNSALSKYMQQLSIQIDDLECFISGRFTNNFSNNVPKGIKLLHSLDELMAFIEAR